LKYFDTTYLGRLYLQDSGWENVRELARTEGVVCALLGRAEVTSSFHRKFREGAFDQKFLSLLLAQFDTDCEAGAFEWLPLSEKIIERLATTYKSLPPTISLRASDGIHLASAAERGLVEIYSNDRRLLSAAPSFGLKGIDIL
jgi:predicted nucleic acid-binding protein